jgi:hypothetical protein
MFSFIFIILGVCFTFAVSYSGPLPAEVVGLGQMGNEYRYRLPELRLLVLQFYQLSVSVTRYSPLNMDLPIDIYYMFELLLTFIITHDLK